MRKRTCLYLLLIVVVIHAQSLAAESRYDFRVVIDVSGSMKQTDPQNLRVPALKLMNGLIPTGSRAGIWTFGRYVNMAVKWGKVDDAWRKRADLGADKIHSIALSHATDEVLLKQLALETGGSFAIAQSADELQKVFFKMFERASQPDTVALKGKEFSIDASVREMTLLIFRGPDSQPTILIPPDSPAISAKKTRGSSWRSDHGYDLITVRNPAAGAWRIDAVLDPDNRLMVVTDLKLHVDGVPAYGTPREAFKVAAELINQGKKISKNSFLRFVDFDMTHIDAEGNHTQHALTHTTERKDKGQYLYPVDQKLDEGLHSFVVSADSTTFNRGKRFDMQVQWPVEVRVEPQAAAGVYELKLRAREEYLKPDGLVADVDIEAPDESRNSLSLEPSSGWLRRLIETDQDGLYYAHIKISAQSHATEIVDIDLGRFSMLGVYRAATGVRQESAMTSDKETAEQGEDASTINWKLVGVIIVVINLTLLLLLLSGWWLIQRKRGVPEPEYEDEEFSA